MKLLVTGGLGFIASNFIRMCLEKHSKYQIINVDAKLPGSNEKNLKAFKKIKNYSFVYGNITNQKLMDKLILKSDIVINFAAESHVDRSIKNPRPFLDSNVIGVYTILESIRKFKKKFIHISTDEVFGSLKRKSADENYPLNPSSPYSSTKASAELLIKSYITTYNSKIIVTRCTNNYGPMQFSEKLIPKIILSAMKNCKIPIYGDGKNIRDWIYVDDHCNAIITVMEKGKFGQSYNIAGKNEVNNNTIVKQILDIMGKPKSLINYVKDRPGHDFRYSLNSKKIEKELKVKPKHSFEVGLKKTIDWYENNQNW